MTTLVTFALGLLIYGQLNAVSLGFAAIFFGLSIDAANYFYTRFLEEWDGGENLEPALAAATGALFWPAVVASATTAAVFVVIGFSALTGVAQLGYLTAIGMMLNVPATFVLLPGLMLWLQRRSVTVARWHALPPTSRLARVAGASESHPRATLAFGLGAIAAAGALALGARLDMNLFHLRPAHSAAASVQDEITQSFGISDPEASVMVEIDAPVAASAAADEAVLQTTERVAQRLAQLRDEGLVRSFTSPSPLMPSLATQKARLEAWSREPREAAAQRLARRLEDDGFAIDAFAPALAALRSTPAPIDATLEPLPGLELLFEHHLKRDARGLALQTPLAARDPDALEEIARRLPHEVQVAPGVRVLVAGRPLMERELRRTMRGEIGWFLLFSVVSNAVVIWLQERRLGVTAILLAIPLGVVVLLLGVGAAADWPLNPVNLIVLPLTIGVGVDYCVYFRARARETGSFFDAAAGVGRALAVTAATTVAGFGILGFSRYPALSSLGVLAALSMALCFACAVIFLPATLVLHARFSGRENRRLHRPRGGG
jgi:predicted RND superfamily exporter protein